MAKARTKDRLHAFSKLARRVDGRLALISDPPLVVPAAELLPERDEAALAGAIKAILNEYTASLRPDLRRVVESYQPLDVARKVYANQGRRVVEGQRLMQAAGDLLLGWIRTGDVDGVERDFYVRQLWDWKYSVEIEALDAERLAGYAGLCGWTLARAHARTGDRVAIAAYLGANDSFDDALAQMAEDYADTNDSDHEALLNAVRAGRIQADTSM
jgi:hypothetical protein